MSNYCKGCRTYLDIINNKEVFYCSGKRFNRKGKCPCSSCIVKMMCKVVCNDFDFFIESCKDQDRYDRRYEL